MQEILKSVNNANSDLTNIRFEIEQAIEIHSKNLKDAETIIEQAT